MESIYLDHNATTPVDPAVIDAMLPYLNDSFGNASSTHSFGRNAKVALENARETIAGIINCQPSELYFTSGGTESDNIAVLGTAFQYPKKKHLIVGSTEHPAVFEPAEYLHHHHDYDLDMLPVDIEGLASAEVLSELLSDNTVLVSVMHANNETGAVQNLVPLTEVTRSREILFHADAVQSIGKIVVDVKALGVDLLSLTGHKIYGPKGTGALFIKQGVKIAPLFYGGSHEKKRRPGTENVAGAIGLAKALEIAEKCREDDLVRLSKMSDHFIETVMATIPDSFLNSPRVSRVPQTVNMSFPGAEGESIILNLDMKGVAASSGSACASGATEPSHVLTAMGIPLERGQSAVRFSLGRSTTVEKLDYVLEILSPIIERLRAMSPTYRQSQT